MKNLLLRILVVGIFSIFIGGQIVSAQTKQPKTVLDFFNLLPQQYFPLEGCSAKPDQKNCERARKEYLKSFLEVEDNANGFMKGGCDGAQRCLTLALFKRPDKSYIVALHTEGDEIDDNYFLEYRKGKWSDISARVIPQFSKKHVYELPRKGTVIEVFRKNPANLNERDKSVKLYDLVWKNGKFTIKK